MFGLTFEKLLIIGVIAVFLLGPERLPHYAGQLARFVRSLRDMANGAKDRMRDEMGPDFDDVDWKKLDPRQYDPRRIIREALLEDPSTPTVSPPTVSPVSAPRGVRGDATSGSPSAGDGAASSATGAVVSSAVSAAGSPTVAPVGTPFDSEAT